MPDQVSTFEAHRAQLAASLVAVADSMRTCAKMADTFAKVVNDSACSPETAEILQGALDGFTKGKRKAVSPEDEDGPKKRRRNIKPKDPNAPKRPASSYILFQNQVRKTLKDTHPGLSNPELLQMISDQWKSMTPEQKEARRPYNLQMREQKSQYTDEKKAYENRTPEEIEAANAATAAAALLKKANAKPRGPRGGAAAAAAAVTAAADAAAKARPPPTADEMAGSDSSEEDQSDDEDTAEPDHAAGSDNSDHDIDEDEESPEPAPKKQRTPPAQPKQKEHKKKSSKA